MASILSVAGFENLETMQEFSNRFPNVPIFFDDELEKVWICHKNPRAIPKIEEVNLSPSRDYQCTSRKILKKIAAGKQFYSFLTEFSVVAIFNKISALFKHQLTTYLFTQCYLFYNWGINAFEPLIDHFEIHNQIQKKEERTVKRVQRRVSWKGFNLQDLSKNTAIGTKRKVVDFSSPLGSSKQKQPKQVSFKSVMEAIKKEEKYYGFMKNERNPYQQKFSLKKILYDMKERSWPRCHVLNKTIDDLITFIIQIPVVTDLSTEKHLIKQSQKWLLLRELLGKFKKNHEKMSENDGYGRILKKHLQNFKKPPDRRLQPIPKNNICSFIFDILRRALPVELFGGNRVRKSFFSELVKVINGNKDENFIWFPLLSRLLQNRSRLPWCTQLGSHCVQNQIVLKLFKFFIIHYVFVILKNNFYVTETGSSVLALRFYRKCDMESASSACLRNLLQQGHLEGALDEDYTIERNWLNSGTILEGDLRRKLKTTMTRGTEYRQPTARVRFLPKNDFGDDFRLITNIERMEKHPQVNGYCQKLKKYFKARLNKRRRNLFFVKLFLRYLVDKRGCGILPLPSNRKLEAAWKKAVYLREKYGKLFFVKADISDAFGSINHGTLTEVLRRAYENEVKHGKVQLKRIVEWKMAKSSVRKAARFSFSNRTAENSVMISRSIFLQDDKQLNRYLNPKFLEIINQVAMQQKMQVKGRLFRLARGLAQGSAGRFSTSLCEIYYSSLDEALFGSFITSTDSILVRGVDDYLFVSSDPDRAKSFLDLVQNKIPGYDIRFNRHKLKSNLIEDVKEVLYLGLIFNFDGMCVRPSYSKYQQSGLLSNVNLSDISEAIHFNKELFLRRRSMRLNCLKLHSIAISRSLNNLKIIRQIVFEACLLQCLRVLSLADYLFSGRVKNDSGVYRTLLLSCSKIKKLVACSGISPEEVNWLFLYSALNVLQKYSGQFKILLLVIRYLLQRSEKRFAHKNTEVLLNLIKSDILDEDYWRGVRGRFTELNPRPLKV